MGQPVRILYKDLKKRPLGFGFQEAWPSCLDPAPPSSCLIKQHLNHTLGQGCHLHGAWWGRAQKWRRCHCLQAQRPGSRPSFPGHSATCFGRRPDQGPPVGQSHPMKTCVCQSPHHNHSWVHGSRRDTVNGTVAASRRTRFRAVLKGDHQPPERRTLALYLVELQ